MPRKSKSALSIAPPPQVGSLPEPPAELTEYQAAIWHSVVQTKPSDWFGADSFPLLIAYCKHIGAASIIDQQIDKYRPEWLETDDGVARLEKLVNMRCKLTGKVESLATKMRLTQQARYDTQKAAVQSRKGAGVTARRPWEES